VTIEHGHGNHLANEMSSVAYWYADTPAAAVVPPPLAQRSPVPRDNQAHWLYDEDSRYPEAPVELNNEMKRMKANGLTSTTKKMGPIHCQIWSLAALDEPWLKRLRSLVFKGRRFETLDELTRINTQNAGHTTWNDQ
jgi:hypothetical protein